jgi:plastocyanin
MAVFPPAHPLGPRRRLALWGAAAAVTLAASPADAAALDGLLLDAAGKPLPDAVLLLDPVGAKPALKPGAVTEISQAKRTFQPRVTVVTAGTPVTFPNFDTVRHHVYSISPIKTFEIKLYAGVPTAPVVFDKPGIAVLGCNIHDQMAAWIVVADTPWFALARADGRARIDTLPAGAYRARLWHPGLNGPPVLLADAVQIGSTDQRQTFTLPGSKAP